MNVVGMIQSKHFPIPFLSSLIETEGSDQPSGIPQELLLPANLFLAR